MSKIVFKHMQKLTDVSLRRNGFMVDKNKRIKSILELLL